MNPFLQAVRDGDLMKAKSAFNQEMLSRTATTVASMRNEIANSIPLPEHPVSIGADDE
ncbi:MAG: hypothetical protein [Caudoviricetes sp.]|nr:MAG: hypothetical protein [Caudoviricetes sp.]